MRKSYISKMRHLEDRNRLDGVNLEHHRWYVDYHYKAMDTRRSIQIKVFTGLVVVDLALLKGATEFLLGPAGTENIRQLIEGIHWLLFIVFLGFIISAEAANRRNRSMYHKLEDRLKSHLENIKVSDPAPIKEKWWQTLFYSWAGTWTVIAGFTLTLIAYALIENIPLKASSLRLQAPSQLTVTIPDHKLHIQPSMPSQNKSL